MVASGKSSRRVAAGKSLRSWGHLQMVASGLSLPTPEGAGGIVAVVLRRGAAAGRPPVRRRRDERGETLALLVVWPALITAILLLLVHAFIVTNARSEAELAASQGLRSAWRASADSDFLTDPNSPGPYTGNEPHPDVLAMAEASKDAVARAAATEGGWRWWTPGVAEVHSDWCFNPRGNPSDPPGSRRPVADEAGWVRVVVSGEVFGPLAALWPNRWDRVYAAAQGPALLVPPDDPTNRRGIDVPAQLPAC